MLKEQRVARARLGVASRTARRTGDPDDIARRDQLDAEYRTVALAEHVRQVVAKAPPLSPEQRERIAALLR